MPPLHLYSSSKGVFALQLQCWSCRLRLSPTGPLRCSKALLVFSISGSFLSSGSRPAPEEQKPLGLRELTGGNARAEGQQHLLPCLLGFLCPSQPPPVPLISSDTELPPGTSCVSMDHLEFCSRAGEKGFPVLSIAPTDPAAPGPPKLGKTHSFFQGF